METEETPVLSNVFSFWIPEFAGLQLAVYFEHLRFI